MEEEQQNALPGQWPIPEFPIEGGKGKQAENMFAFNNLCLSYSSLTQRCGQEREMSQIWVRLCVLGSSLEWAWAAIRGYYPVLQNRQGGTFGFRSEIRPWLCDSAGPGQALGMSIWKVGLGVSDVHFWWRTSCERLTEWRWLRWRACWNGRWEAWDLYQADPS